jgi:hypothetical protein
MIVRHLRSRISMAVLVGLTVSVVGCNSALVGSWENSSKPEGQPFYLHNVTFKSDGTYTASAKQGEENVRLAGTYEFDGFGLKLKQPGKPEKKYGATNVMGQKLELSDGKNKQTLIKK